MLLESNEDHPGDLHEDILTLLKTTEDDLQ